LVDAPDRREGGRLSQREVLAERELLAEADGGGVVAKELPLGGERLAKPTFAATRPLGAADEEFLGVARLPFRRDGQGKDRAAKGLRSVAAAVPDDDLHLGRGPQAGPKCE